MATWSFDGAHSSVEFSAKHMVFTTVRGRFDDVDVKLDFNEANPEASSVVAEIKATSINTGQDYRDNHLRSADFLDAENFPLLRFESTSVEPKRTGGADYLIHGNLTIRGVTRPVTLEAEFLGTQPDFNKEPAKRRAAFSAATKISRKDWGLTWNVGLESGGLLVGDAITIAIEVAAVAEVDLATAALSPHPFGNAGATTGSAGVLDSRGIVSGRGVSAARLGASSGWISRPCSAPGGVPEDGASCGSGR